MKCFPNLFPRVDARLHLDAATDFRIKGRCWNALRALSPIPEIVLLPSNRPPSQFLCLHPLRPHIIAIPQVMIPLNTRIQSQGVLESPPPKLSTSAMITSLFTRTTGQGFGWPLVLYTTVLMLMPCPREVIREPAAEALGTMILTLLGTAGNCQAVLSANTGVAATPKGDYLSLSFGWACGPSTLIFYCSTDNGHWRRCFLGRLGRRRRHWRPRESRGMPFSWVIPFPVLKGIALYR
jgi:hypothetical protein